MNLKGVSKLATCLTLIVMLVGLSMGQAYAQKKKSKKVLRKENKVLIEQNANLQKQKFSLENENNALQNEKVELENKVSRLQNDNQQMRATNSQLQADNASLKSKLELSESENEDLKNKANGQLDHEKSLVADAKRPCGKRQGKLQMNKSYFIDLSSQIISKGWGLQVYSSSNLCQAQDYAEKFTEYYQMWNTYIKVKSVGGEVHYCVVYGSLKHKDQAQVYCENFKKIGQDDGQKKAFLVQHQ